MRNLITVLVLIILILAIAVYRLSEPKPKPQPSALVTLRYDPDALAIAPVFRPGDILDFKDPPKWTLGIDPCEHGPSPCQLRKVGHAVYSYDCQNPNAYCQDPEIVVDDTIIIETAASSTLQNGTAPTKQPPHIDIGCNANKTFQADPPRMVAKMETHFVWTLKGELGADWMVTVPAGYCRADNGGLNTIFNAGNRACNVLKDEAFTYTISSPSMACKDGTGMVAPN